MRHRLIACLCLAALAACYQAAAQPELSADAVAEPGATLTLLADGFSFTEGPAADAAGNVYFTDQPSDRILRYGVDGELSTFLEPCGRANGLCFDADGNLLACADDHNELWRIAPDGEVTVLVSSYGARLLNGPNDVWVHPSGGIYFTDPFYKRPYWQRGEMEQDAQCVYYLAPGSTEPIRVAEDLVQPNGLVGTPDGKRLYVADIGAGRTYSYDTTTNGRLSNKNVLTELGSDGVTLDSEGNVYLTGQGVTVFSPAGERIAHIAVDEPWTANVCFGGADGRTLFITAGRALYGMRMRVHGVGSQ
jgi:gluconolactonase